MARRRDTTQANYALRLQASLKAEAERVAEREGTTLNQFINVAVAENSRRPADRSVSHDGSGRSSTQVPGPRSGGHFTGS